jgi:serine/threonine protein kinase/WD40 repeat protein
MTIRAHPDDDDASLPLQHVRQVDAACCRFEAAWQAASDPAQRPRIETFLATVPESAQPTLLRELVALEIDLRRRAGEDASADEYRERFLGLPAPQERTPPEGESEGVSRALARVDIPGYESIHELGRGGMGVVYWAWQSSLSRPVALKMILAGAHAGAEVLARFRTEAEAVARLHHPNIVQIYDVGWHGPCPYMALEYVNGGSLARRLRGTPLPARETAGIVENLARAIHYAHERGVVHRDLAPANVLLTADGVPKITDFGLAKLLIGAGPTLTHTTDILGTPNYMAPEQAAGKAGLIGPATDVYALGAILYQMLTGRPPFKAETLHEALRQVESVEPISPKRLQPNLPGDLATITLKCLEKAPAKRYVSAQAFGEDLGRFLAGEPIRARPVSQAERLWRWCRRNPVVAALLTTVLLLLLTLTVSTLVKNAQLSAALRASQEANRDATARLWESLRDRARALRMSRAPGQRLESLKSIRQALDLPLPPGHSLAELQTEAIAALALPDLEVQRAWEGNPAGNIGLDFDSTLTQYARLGTDGTVTVRRVHDDEVIACWQEPLPGPWKYEEGNLCFSPDGRYLCVRHLTAGRLLVRRLEGKEGILCHESPADAEVRRYKDMDFSPDSQRLIYVLKDAAGSRLAVVDLPSGQVRSLQGSGADDIAGPRFAPDGRRFGQVARRGTAWALEVRDAGTGQEQQRLIHKQQIYRFAWHPDGQTLVASYNDRVLRWWHVPTRKVMRELKGHKDHGIYYAFTPHGERLLSNDWASLLRLWEPASGTPLLSFPAGGYAWLRVSADQRIVTADVADVTKVQLLQLHPGLEYRSMALDQNNLDYGVRGDHLLTVHPDGRLLAAAATDNTLRLVDLAAGRELANLGPLSFAPLPWREAGALEVNGTAGLLRWPLREDQAEPGRYQCGPPESILPGEYPSEWGSSADAQTLAIPQGTHRTHGAVLLYRGQPARRFDLPLEPGEDIRSCAVSGDGRWVASGSHSTTGRFAAKVWDAATGKLVQKLPVPGLCRVAFSPDDRWLLTTSGGCRLWHVESWDTAHHVGGTCGCFSPDGQLLAVDDSAGAIRLVRPASGATLARLEAPEQARLLPRGFSPDGTRLIAVGADTKALHVWDLAAVVRGLRALGLQGELPSYPPPREPRVAPALRIDVVLKGH